MSRPLDAAQLIADAYIDAADLGLSMLAAYPNPRFQVLSVCWRSLLLGPLHFIVAIDRKCLRLSRARGHWCAGGSNYSVPVPGAAGSQLAKENPLAGFEDELSRTIVDCEVNTDQWTLMHRYNKATELLEQAVNVCPSPSLAGLLASL